MSARTILFVLFLASSSGCSTAPSAQGDAAVVDAGTTDAAVADAAAIDAGTADGGPTSDAATACTSIAPGATVTSENVATDSPIPAGGTVTDGTYTLTAIRAYTGPGGASGTGTRMLSGAVRFTGSAYELVLVERGTADGSSGTFTTSGTQVMLTRTCPPSTTTPSLPYDVAPGRFDLYLPPNLALTFTAP